MNFFEKAMTIVFGDNEKDSQCGETNLESIRVNQLKLIRDHFGHRKDIRNIEDQIRDRGVWMISANHEIRGNAHPRYPYFTYPVTGDIFITNRGEVYQYTKPKKGVHPFTLIDHTDDEKLLGCYILELAIEEDLIIPSNVLNKGASKLPGESLADYYKRPGVTAKEEYKKRQNQNRK